MALYPEIYEGVNAAATLTAIVPPGSFFFGAENLAENTAPPRVIWVPVNDSFAPSSQRGSTRDNSRAIHTATTALEVHLWATDTGSALALRDAFVQALRSVLGPNYHLTGGAWLGQQNVSVGRGYVLSFTVDIPIQDGPLSTVTIAAEDQTNVAFSIPPPH